MKTFEEIIDRDEEDGSFKTPRELLEWYQNREKTLLPDIYSLVLIAKLAEKLTQHPLNRKDIYIQLKKELAN